MKRHLLVFAILIIWAIALGSSQAPKSAGIAKKGSAANARKSDTPNQQAQNPAIAPPNAPAIQNPEKNPPPVSGDNKTNQSDEDMQIQRQMARFTWELVIVGVIQALALVGTVIVAGMQTRALHRHSEHFEELASRLRDQVEISRKALVAQFRPKVVVRSIRFDPPSVEEFDRGTDTGWKIEISIVNMGDTVAHVKYCQAISYWMDHSRRSRAQIATEEWERMLTKVHEWPLTTSTAPRRVLRFTTFPRTTRVIRQTLSKWLETLLKRTMST